MLLGFVALYAAYLEEQIDNLLFMLQPVEVFPETVFVNVVVASSVF